MFAMRRGFTLVELLIVIAVVSILFAVAAPWVLSARRTAHETSAVHSLDAINVAQAAFKEHCGRGQYAASLTGLGVPVPTTGQAFLSPDLTSADEVVKAGYRILMTTDPNMLPANPESIPDNPEATTTSPQPRQGCNGVPTVPAYVITADPVQPGTSGTRFFGTNGGRVIYVSPESLVGKMPPEGAPEGAVELRR